jgi:hypothetical protein
MRLRFGSASRKLVVDQFSSDRIGREIVALYARLLGGTHNVETAPRERSAS